MSHSNGSRRPKKNDEFYGKSEFIAEGGLDTFWPGSASFNPLWVVSSLGMMIAISGLVMAAINTDQRIRVLKPGLCDTCFDPVDVTVRPFTHTIYVDGGADNGGVDPDGSIRYPYTTIQSAIDTVPIATSAIGSRHVYTIRVISGNYDESLLIDGSKRRIVLLADGQVTLGNITGTLWSYDSGANTARNIVWNATSEYTDVPNALVITSVNSEGTAMLPGDSFTGKWRISGGIDIVTNVTLTELHINAEVWGTVSMASTTATTNLYTYNSHFRSAVTGTSTTQFQVCSATDFDALVTVGKYGSMRMCNFDAGMTVSSATSLTAKPEGFISCRIVGTFTGPSVSFKLDGYTNYWFDLASGVLGGSATKVILNDVVA